MTNVINGTPSSVVTTSSARPYGLPIGRGVAVVPVGGRNHITITMAGPNSTTSAGTSYRQFHPLSDPQCGSILPVFGNFNMNAASAVNTGDMDGYGALTVACAVECSDGTIVPFTFNGGQHTVTIPAQGGFLAVPDAPIAFGAQVVQAANRGNYVGSTSGVFLRVYVSQQASRTDTATVTSGSATVTDAAITAADINRLVTGTGIPAGAIVATVNPGVSFTLGTPTGVSVTATNATASGTSVTISSQYQINNANMSFDDLTNGNNGPDLTTYGSGAVAGSGANPYGPSLLLGNAPSGRKPIVLQISDSIFDGTNDQLLGPVQRGCIALGLPLVKMSKFGDYAGAIAVPNQRRYRQQLVPGCTHAVIELGTNDGLDTVPKITTLETAITSIVSWLTSLGIKVWLCTVPPHTTSTDGWATTANQTQSFPAANLATYNSWVRALPTGVSGYFDLGTLVSTAQDSGLFAAGPNGRRVTDAATTSGSNVVTSATANFTNADIGTGIFVAGAITSSVAVIGSLNSSTSVNVTNTTPTGGVLNAGATVSGAVMGIGAYYATTDGTHPSSGMHSTLIAPGISTLLQTFTL